MHQHITTSTLGVIQHIVKVQKCEGQHVVPYDNMLSLGFVTHNKKGNMLSPYKNLLLWNARYYRE